MLEVWFLKDKISLNYPFDQVRVTLGEYVLKSDVEPLPGRTYGASVIKVHPYFKFTPQEKWQHQYFNIFCDNHSPHANTEIFIYGIQLQVKILYLPAT